MMAQKENMVNTLWMQVALIGVQLEKMTSQYQVPFFVEVCRYCKPKIKSRKQSMYIQICITYFVVVSPGPFAGQEDEFALYDENGNKVETSSSKEEASGEL